MWFKVTKVTCSGEKVHYYLLPMKSGGSTSPRRFSVVFSLDAATAAGGAFPRLVAGLSLVGGWTPSFWAWMRDAQITPGPHRDDSLIHGARRDTRLLHLLRLPPLLIQTFDVQQQRLDDFGHQVTRNLLIGVQQHLGRLGNLHENNIRHVASSSKIEKDHFLI